MIEWLKVKFLNAFIDKQRRKHVLSRVIESFVPSTLIIGFSLSFANGWYWPLMTWLVAAVLGALITFGEYLLYEFVLEPLGTIKNWFTTGHYWERGPRDGETFKIG